MGQADESIEVDTTTTIETSVVVAEASTVTAETAAAATSDAVTAVTVLADAISKESKHNLGIVQNEEAALP